MEKLHITQHILQPIFANSYYYFIIITIIKKSFFFSTSVAINFKIEIFYLLMGIPSNTGLFKVLLLFQCSDCSKIFTSFCSHIYIMLLIFTSSISNIVNYSNMSLDSSVLKMLAHNSTNKSAQ